MKLSKKDSIEKKIYWFRGMRVMLDSDLAELYGVPTKALIQAVKRNEKRFPQDFMARLSKNEMPLLRSQIVTSNWGGRRYQPYVFTEQGVAMLSSVLKSDRAIQVNIEIMRAFVQLRQMIQHHKDLWDKIKKMERKYDKKFKIVFDVLRELLHPPVKSKGKIGFHTHT